MCVYGSLYLLPSVTEWKLPIWSQERASSVYTCIIARSSSWSSSCRFMVVFLEPGFYLTQKGSPSFPNLFPVISFSPLPFHPPLNLIPQELVSVVLMTLRLWKKFNSSSQTAGQRCGHVQHWVSFKFPKAALISGWGGCRGWEKMGKEEEITVWYL